MQKFSLLVVVLLGGFIVAAPMADARAQVIFDDDFFFNDDLFFGSNFFFTPSVNFLEGDTTLTPEQQQILETRGVLAPDEIHKLASKTKQAMSTTGPTVREAAADKAACHSDYVDADEAQQVQREKEVVQVDVRPALGIGKKDSII